jgi:hypothetical protein
VKLYKILTYKIQKVFFSPRIFWVFCGLLATAKLILVGREEIVARNQGYDDLWHILAAARGYWLRPYSHMTLVHLPVYALWIALVHFTGLPLRVGTELLFLASGLAFVVALSRAQIPKGVCLCAFCLTIFHPVSFQLFNYSLAETLYAPILLFGVSGVIMMWAYRDNKSLIGYAIVTGIFFSLLWNIRKENILISSLLFATGVAAFLILRYEEYNMMAILNKLGIIILIPGALILIVTLSIKTLNYIKFGVFVTNEMSAPGYTAAYEALQRISPDKPIRFVPVPRDVREKAYLVSPAFRELKPYLEGDPGQAWAAETQRVMGIRRQIGAGWFYWALRDAVALSGHEQTASQAESYYFRIAREVDTAIRERKIPGRRVLVAFIDPDISNYLPYLGQSFLKIAELFTSTKEWQREKDGLNLSESIREAVDNEANRRSALVQSKTVTLQGWAFNDNAGIKSIFLRAADGSILASTEQFSSRPDVVRHYMESLGNVVPGDTGFTLTAHWGPQLSTASLVFLSGGGKETIVPYSQVKVAGPLALSGSNSTLTFCLDFISRGEETGRLRKSIQSLIWATYGKIVLYLTFLNGLGLMVLLFCYRKIDVREEIYFVLFVLLFVILSRVALFTLIDASAWPGNQPRYLFPVMPLYSSFLIIFLYKALSLARLSLKRKSGGKNEDNGIL